MALMFDSTLYALPVVLVVILILIKTTVKILREYERAVVFTLGRFQAVKGPGLVLLVPFIREMVRVDLRTNVIEIPSQDVISHDNVSMKVDAVLYFSVVDPERAKIIHAEAEFQAAQTLVDAASILGSVPAAMQLRYLQTLAEIGAEQNSTIVFPMPIDIVKPFFDLLERGAKAPARPIAAQLS